jgi:hypothetical protein
MPSDPACPDRAPSGGDRTINVASNIAERNHQMSTEISYEIDIVL